MSQNLISIDRARLAVSASADADEQLLDNLIAAASRGIEKWCCRVFSLASYDEMPGIFHHDGRLMLRRFPVQSIEAVRHSPAVVMQVQNTNLTTNQIARLAVTATAFELTTVASAVKTVNTLNYSDYPTLAAMAAAVNALGNGWNASVVGNAAGDYGLWPCGDLYIPPWVGDSTRSVGALGCRGTPAPIYLHVGECNSYAWDAPGWLEIRDNGLLPVSMWFPLSHSPFGQGPNLSRFYRVQYTAGFPVIPEDVQEACAIWVRELWYRAGRDPLLRSSSSNSVLTTGAASGSSTNYAPAVVSPASESLIPDPVKALLAAYRIRNV